MIFFIIFFLSLSPLDAETNHTGIKYKQFNVFLSELEYVTNFSVINFATIEPKTNRESQSIKPLTMKKKTFQTNKKKAMVLSEEDQIFNSGINLFKQENYKEAENIFVELMQKYPDSRLKYEITYYLGDIQFYMKKYDEALLYYNKIIQDVPGREAAAKAYYKIAKVNYQKKEYSDCLKTLGLLMAQYKKSSIIDDAYLLQGEAYSSLKQFHNAIAAYETIISKYPDADTMDDTYWALGEVYESAPPVRNLEKALQYYQKIVDNFPDSPYYDKARQRIQFLKENFLEYK